MSCSCGPALACACHSTGGAFQAPCDVPGGCGSAAAPRPDAPSRVYARASRPAAEPDASTAGERDAKPLDLAEVVASLVRPTVAEVVVEARNTVDGSLLLVREQHTVRPLLDELRAEVVPGGESGGSGRGGGVPISVDVADVLRDLGLLVFGQLVQLGLKRRRDRRECYSCGTPLEWCQLGVDPNTGRRRIGPYGLDCCSRHRHREAPDAIADALAQLVPAHFPTTGVPARFTRAGFTADLAELVDRGRAVLDGLTSSTYVRDTRCPVCLAEWVGEPVAGGWDRHPALRVNRAKPDADGTPGPVRGTTCTHCHLRWSWEEMQGPTADQPAGALWLLLAADREVLAAGRRRRERLDRAAELAERRRLYGDPERTTA